MLETNNLFLASLSPEDLEHFADALKPVALEMGQILFDVEDEVQHVWFPEDGLVSVITVLRSSDTAETSVVGREGALGYLEALGSGRSFSRGLVQVQGRALRADVRSYRDTYDRSQGFRHRLAAHAEWRMSEARQIIACTALHSLSQRLIRWLLECQDRISGDDLPITQDLLSTMLAVQRTTVTQVAGELQERGLIRTRRGHILILDRPGLERAACECYTAIRNFRQVTEGRADIAPVNQDRRS